MPEHIFCRFPVFSIPFTSNSINTTTGCKRSFVVLLRLQSPIPFSSFCISHVVNDNSLDSRRTAHEYYNDAVRRLRNETRSRCPSRHVYVCIGPWFCTFIDRLWPPMRVSFVLSAMRIWPTLYAMSSGH